jgi:hypothetical protein
MEEVLVLAGATVLAWLGVRKRKQDPEAATTPGQRLETMTAQIPAMTGNGIRTVGHVSASASRMMVRTAGIGGSEVVARLVQASNELSAGMITMVVGAVTKVAARPAGLIVDGAATIAENLASSIGFRPGSGNPADKTVAVPSQASPTEPTATLPPSQDTATDNFVTITSTSTKFHRPDCSVVANKQSLSIPRDQARAEDRTPCRSCRP